MNPIERFFDRHPRKGLVLLLCGLLLAFGITGRMDYDDQLRAEAAQHPTQYANQSSTTQEATR